jgi:TPR repeat protein
LGRAYLDGEGGRKNIKFAHNWLFKAAQHGHAKARRLLQSRHFHK